MSWRSPLEAPKDCECRRPGKAGNVTCGGVFGGEDPCPGFAGHVDASGWWFEEPAPPPREAVANADRRAGWGKYEDHADYALSLILASGGTMKATAAARQAIEDLGRGPMWQSNEADRDVPRQLRNLIRKKISLSSR